MYNSPINIIYGQMQTQMEGDILRAVQQYGINVDKEELIRALRYDRDQYDRGFADSYMNAQQELVMCSGCKYYEYGHCRFWNAKIHPENYCSWGENKSEDLSL